MIAKKIRANPCPIRVIRGLSHPTSQTSESYTESG